MTKHAAKVAKTAPTRIAKLWEKRQTLAAEWYEFGVRADKGEFGAATESAKANCEIARKAVRALDDQIMAEPITGPSDLGIKALVGNLRTRDGAILAEDYAQLIAGICAISNLPKQNWSNAFIAKFSDSPLAAAFAGQILEAELISP